MKFFNIFHSTIIFHHPLIECGSINGLQKCVKFYSKSSDELQKVLASIPEKPKKPMSTYLRFIKLAEPQIKREYPNANRKEIIKAAAVLWKNAEEDTLSRLKNEYSKEMELYKRTMTTYRSSFTEEQYNAIKRNEIRKKQKNQNSELKKKRIELEIPKRPMNPYCLFVSANRPAVLTIKAKDFMVKMATEWKKLSEEEREKYHHLYLNNKKKYLADLTKWETKMMKLGHSDLLKSSKSITESKKIPDSPPKKRVSSEPKGKVDSSK